MEKYESWFQARVGDSTITPAANPLEYVEMYCKLHAEAVRVECDQQAKATVQDVRRECEGVIRKKADAIQGEWEQKVVEERRKSRGKMVTAFEERREAREVLRGLGKSIAMVDGNDKGVLRMWLDDIERAAEISRAGEEEVVRFALANCRGDLHKIVHATWKKLGALPWPKMMTEIANTLLTADEESYLRDRVTNMFQLKGESEPSYCQRYWDAVYKAWPEAQMNQQILAMLLSQFADSLREVQTRWHVKVNNPQTAEEAVRLATSSGRALVSRRHRDEEEDMEIGEADASPPAPAAHRECNALRTIQGEIKSLVKKVYRCEEVGAAREEGIRRDFRRAQEFDQRRVKQAPGPHDDRERDMQMRARREVRCYLCGAPHMMKACPMLGRFQRWMRTDGARAPRQMAAYLGN